MNNPFYNAILLLVLVGLLIEAAWAFLKEKIEEQINA